MNYLPHVGFSVLILTLQTVLMSSLFPAGGSYDLFIPYIYFLGVCRSASEGFVVTCCIGLLADSLSAAPFGLYETAYLWFFFIIRWGQNLLQVRRRFFVPLAVIMGVFIEGIVFLLPVFVMRKSGFPDDAFRILAGQSVWGGLTGFLVFMGISGFYKKWGLWIGNISAERNDRN